MYDALNSLLKSQYTGVHRAASWVVFGKSMWVCVCVCTKAQVRSVLSPSLIIAPFLLTNSSASDLICLSESRDSVTIGLYESYAIIVIATTWTPSINGIKRCLYWFSVHKWWTPLYVFFRKGPPPPSYNRTSLSSETKNKAPLALAPDSVRIILPSFFY